MSYPKELCMKLLFSHGLMNDNMFGKMYIYILA